MPSFESDFARAYGASVPLAHVVTSDEPGAQTTILRELAALEQPPLVYLYSRLLGLEAMGERSAQRMAEICGKQAPAMLRDPAVMLGCLAQLPPSSDTSRVILWSGADRAWSDAGLGSALTMMRDRLVQRGVTLVGLGDGAIDGAVSSHVHTMREQLPSDAERRAMIDTLLGTNGVKYTQEQLTRAVNGTRGLTRFAVLQVCSLAILDGELELATLYERWSESLSSLPGVTVERALPAKSFAGYAGWLEHLMRYKQVNPSLVVVLDEFEKIVPRADSNDAGVSRSLLQLLLRWMQRTLPIANIAVGTMGTGKTLSALVAGDVYQCPIVSIDLSAFKSSLVGASEENARRTFGMVAAFGGKQVVVATANEVASIDGALKNRFRGTWYFPMPDHDTVMPAIWQANFERYGVTEALPTHAPGFNGRDCELCIQEAIDQGCSVASVAARRVPTGVTLAADIEAMNEEARRGSYLDARTGEVFSGVASVVSTNAPRALRGANAAPAAAAGEELF